MIRKINTLNYDGKRKRFQSRAGTAYFKYKDFKKAVVYFDKSFRDFGLGTRVPELEEDMGDGEYDINEDNSMDVDIEPPAPVIEKGRSRPKRLS